MAKSIKALFRQRSDQRAQAQRFAQSLTLVGARHSEESVVSSVDDLEHGPNAYLIDLLIRSAQIARELDLTPLIERINDNPNELFVETWPGEHYRLLPAMCEALGARKVVEIGTYKGHATLALKLCAEQVITFDIVPFTSLQNAVLTNDDMINGIEQRIGDLSEDAFFQEQKQTLLDADMIFVDGPKDGRFERIFSERLFRLLSGTGTVVVWDDIRLLPMVGVWRHFPVPKLDATSFGHWSGTGMTQCV